MRTTGTETQCAAGDEFFRRRRPVREGRIHGLIIKMHYFLEGIDHPISVHLTVKGNMLRTLPKKCFGTDRQGDIRRDFFDVSFQKRIDLLDD